MASIHPVVPSKLAFLLPPSHQLRLSQQSPSSSRENHELTFSPETACLSFKENSLRVGDAVQALTGNQADSSLSEMQLWAGMLCSASNDPVTVGST